MSKQKKHNPWRITILVVVCVVATYLIASFWYRNVVGNEGVERGFAKAGMKLPNELPMKAPIPEGRPVRVLSLDAGGIRGILELHILAHIEEKSGKPISELFDLFVGTSTGTMITSALLTPDKDGKPRYSAKELLGLYNEQIRSFTDVPWYHNVFTLNGWIGPKYSVERGREFVHETFGDLTMAELLGDAVLTAVDMEKLSPRFMRSRKPTVGSADSDDNNFLVCDAVMAATAAPSLVPPMQLRDVTGKPAFVSLDGGLFAYDPAPLAVSEVIRRYPGRQFVLLSLGTGDVEFGLTAKKTQGWGKLEWASELLPSTLRPSIRYSNIILGQVAGESKALFVAYLRINPKLPTNLTDALYSSPEVISELDSIGQNSLSNNTKALDEFMEYLVKRDQGTTVEEAD